MKQTKAEEQQLTQREAQMVEQLRQHPELMERFESILGLANHGAGPWKTADEVEELLVAEVRRLGHATMNRWAIRAEERVSTELKGEDPTVRRRKKKR